MLSYLFFGPEFAAALIELGYSHAQHWLATHRARRAPWQLNSADLTPWRPGGRYQAAAREPTR